MKTIKAYIEGKLTEIFINLNFDTKYAKVSESNFADFQCNGALPLAKINGKNPLDVAKAIAEKLSCEDIIATANKGFINIDVSSKFLETFLQDMKSPEANGKKILIDYGGPNIAKTMHIGHLRSAIIGESLKRISRYFGYSVDADVHLGDWGLQMGMIIEEILATDIPDNFDANTLLEIYRKASAECNADPEKKQKAQQRTALLQKGGPISVFVWEKIKETSLNDIKATYEKLGVSFDLWNGESDYQLACENLIKTASMAVISEGALVINLTGLPPLILQKENGGILYGTTDLATLLDRKHYDHIWYVVDNRQETHFQQVFQAANMFASTNPEHIMFGTINGADGKPFKTREGETVSLNTLIDNAYSMALARMDENIPNRETVAWNIAIAAVKFADLQNDRLSDYAFDLDKFLSFEGKTGPYILYTAVRCKSILEKYSEFSDFKITNPEERKLARQLCTFPQMMNNSFTKRQPHWVAEQAYQLATSFNNFYHHHTVVGVGSRATLVKSVLDQLTLLCDLLGITIPDQM